MLDPLRDRAVFLRHDRPAVALDGLRGHPLPAQLILERYGHDATSRRQYPNVEQVMLAAENDHGPDLRIRIGKDMIIFSFSRWQEDGVE